APGDRRHHTLAAGTGPTSRVARRDHTPTGRANRRLPRGPDGTRTTHAARRCCGKHECPGLLLLRNTDCVVRFGWWSATRRRTRRGSARPGPTRRPAARSRRHRPTRRRRRTHRTLSDRTHRDRRPTPARTARPRTCTIATVGRLVARPRG